MPVDHAERLPATDGAVIAARIRDQPLRVLGRKMVATGRSRPDRRISTAPTVTTRLTADREVRR